MKKVILIILVSLLTNTMLRAQTPVIQALGPTDICSPSYASFVTLQVINPLPGYTYQWEQIMGDCSSNYGGWFNFFTGSTVYVYSSGLLRCNGFDINGNVTPVSNEILVRVLAPQSHTIYAPIVSYISTNCVTSATLCVPSVLWDFSWGATSISWYKDNVSISNVSPSITVQASGYYKYSIAGSGCSFTSWSDSIYVNVVPSASITPANSATICQGGNVLLTANTHPNISSYQWKLNGNNITGATNSNFTATAVGGYTVTINYSCGAVSTSPTTTVTIANSFTPVVLSNGPAFKCDNSSVLLETQIGAGYLYQWYLGTNAISGATSVSYNALATGRYKVRITDASGCYNTSTDYNIISGPQSYPIRTSVASTVFCEGRLVYLNHDFVSFVNGTNNVPSSYQYQWKLNGVNITGATDWTHIFTTTQANAGTYTLDITTDCVTSTSNPLVITVNPNPISTTISYTGNNYFCTTGSVPFTSTSQTGVTYQWRNGGTSINGATNLNFTATVAGNYNMMVTNGSGCTSASNYVGVYSKGFLPTITPNTFTSACAPLTLSASPASGGYTYQWQYYNNITGSTGNIVGATSATYSAPATPTLATYDYKCYITGSCGTEITPSVEVYISSAPITAGNISYISGGSPTCSNVNVGYQYGSYVKGRTWQWKLNGVDIPGATSRTYYTSTAGTYSCYLANGCGGSLSANSLTLSVNPLPTAAITASGSINLCNGASVTLNANSGTGLVYAWYRNGSLITGASAISYNTNLGGSYRCVVTNTNGCTANSNYINVFTGTGSTASITGSTTFCAGSGNILTANTGSGITYQWYRNTVLQNGATSSTFNANSNGTYYVVESSSCGTAQSNSIVVTQINNPNATISYTTPLSFCAPGSVVLTSSTFSGVSYQWQKNSVDIAGATFQNYSATSNGTYRVRQTANGCFKYSPALSVTTATTVAATITANGPVTFCTGGSVVLSVNNAVPGYSYQWKNNNVNISGATQSSYTAAAAGSYTCTVTANCGTATSNAIVVSTGGITASVNPSGPVSICPGATAALSANTGNGYSYQWMLNGNNITGATNQSFNATSTGSYSVFISSPCGNATSAATVVNIANVTASISPSGSATICAGSAQTFTANTGYNFVYQWFRNGVVLAGATSSTYATSNYGSYTVRVTQSGICSATSAASVLSVTNNPTPTVTPQGPTAFCAGQSVVLQANSFAGVVFQWKKNGIDITGATSQNYTATTAGSYRVKQTANGCTKSSPTVTVTVNCREAGGNFEDATSSELKVMPNPFTNELIVTGMKFNAGDRADLIDVLGKTVLSYNIDLSTQNLKLKTQNIKPGVYFLIVITSREQKAVRVVRQ